MDGPHRPSFTLVAEMEAPTWPTLRQKKVEFGHAPVPKWNQHIEWADRATDYGRTWLIRTVWAIAVVVVHGSPRDGTGTIETGPEVGGCGDIFWVQRRVDALDPWAQGCLNRDGDGEREQEGKEEHTAAITERGVVGKPRKYGKR